MLLACASSMGTKNEMGPGILFSHNQDEVDTFVARIRAGSITIDPSWLEDTRKLPGDVLLRTKYAMGISQFGVETVSDFFTCILEIMNNTSTPEIFLRVRPDQRNACVLDTCEACNSWTYPLDPEVRAAIITYWKRFLEEQEHSRKPRPS